MDKTNSLSNIDLLAKKLNSVNKDLKKLSPQRILIIASLFLVIVTVAYFIQRQQDIRKIAAAGDFLENFDINPSSPQPFTQVGQNNWDVQVHSRNNDTWFELETVNAQHAHDCSAPPASHPNSSYEGSVFSCRNHLMTALNTSGYGAIYLTPNHMIDFSDGPAVLKFDLSTEKMSGRDWWDVSVSPFMDAQALPLLSDLSQGVDLQDPNKNSVVITTDNGEGGPNLKVVRNGSLEDYDGVQGWFNIPANESIASGTNQAATRQPFQLTISKTHIKFERLASPTGEHVVFVDTDIPELSWSEGVVQFGHHSYTPTKDNAGNPATWHWDAVGISPAIPFSMIKADKRFTQGGTVNFNAPAPENAYLRFSGICAVRVDGVTAAKQTDSDHPEHMSSYFVPIQKGKKSVDISFADDSWYTTGFGCIAKDFAIWSKEPSVGSQDPTATAIPNEPTATPTQKPTEPTLTPTKTPTNTPTPAVTAQSALSLSPSSSTITSGQDFSVQVRVNTNGQTINGVDAELSYPVNLIEVLSINDTNSNFEIKAEKTASNGVITLAYGTNTPKSGNLLVATINMRARGSGVANINFSSSSVVTSDVSNGDVLNSRTNGSYTIVAPTNTPTLTPTPTKAPTPTPTVAPQRRGDMNLDGKVDVQDLSYLLSKWRTSDSTADINKDGRVNISDLSILLSNWTR